MHIFSPPGTVLGGSGLSLQHSYDSSLISRVSGLDGVFYGDATKSSRSQIFLAAEAFMEMTFFLGA